MSKTPRSPLLDRRKTFETSPALIGGLLNLEVKEQRVGPGKTGFAEDDIVRLFGGVVWPLLDFQHERKQLVADEVGSVGRGGLRAGVFETVSPSAVFPITSSGRASKTHP